MTTTAGRCHNRGRCSVFNPRRRAGYSLLGFVLVVFGLTVVGILTATSLVERFVDRSQRVEDRNLQGIRSAWVRYVSETHRIPSHTNWLAALTPFSSSSPSGLQQSHPEWGPDASLSRVFVVDASLPSNVLPYVQTAAGLDGASTNLLGSAARAMFISSTKRGLPLPIPDGALASNSFNAIWNWSDNPITHSPPSGWPAAWNRFGQFLHVERIHLANLFHRVTCRNLKYGMNGVSSVTNLVTATTTFHFLYGTSLLLAATNGTVKAAHVVTRDVTFDFTAVTNAGPILRYVFVETGGVVATNLGSTGASAHGLHTNGVTLGAAGPRPPAYTNFPASNTGISLDGIDDYVRGTNGLLNNLSAFTVAGWIKPSTSTLKYVDLFGQEGIAEVGFTTPSGKLELWCDNGAKKLHYFYPYGAGDWHHIAAVGDGVTMALYVDSVLVASRVYATLDYGANTNAFNVGGHVFGSGQYFPGVIDEVIAYDRALSSVEIGQLYENQPP